MEICCSLQSSRPGSMSFWFLLQGIKGRAKIKVKEEQSTFLTMKENRKDAYEPVPVFDSREMRGDKRAGTWGLPFSLHPTILIGPTTRKIGQVPPPTLEVQFGETPKGIDVPALLSCCPCSSAFSWSAALLSSHPPSLRDLLVSNLR